MLELRPETQKFFHMLYHYLHCRQVMDAKYQQLDFDHRLAPTKLINIIDLAEEKLQLEDLDIEVEYQGTTIQKFGLAALK